MMTLFCDLLEINWLVATNFGNQDVHILWKIKDQRHFWTGLQMEKYLRRQGSCQPRENFSHTNKSWIIVFYLDSHNEQFLKVQI